MDSGLCVILKDAEHEALTKNLMAAINTNKIHTPADLWQAYKKAYAHYPHWLEAIKPHLVGKKK